jgi:hypothetical protein
MNQGAFRRLTIARAAIIGALCVAARLLAQEQPPREQPGWPCVGRPDPSFFKVAEGSGGQVFLFDRSEVSRSSILMIAAMRHEEILYRAAGSLAAGAHEFAFPIESAVESALFSVSLQCLERVEIVRPSGRALQAADGGVDDHRFQAGRIVTVPQPEPGTWRVRASGRGLFFLVAQAKSDISLDSATFVREGGRPAHEGLVPIDGLPRAGMPQLVRIRLSGRVTDVKARTVSSAFEDIEPIPLRALAAQDGELDLLGEMTPRVPFRIVISGLDALGMPFQRLHAPLFDPTSR